MQRFSFVQKILFLSVVIGSVAGAYWYERKAQTPTTLPTASIIKKCSDEVRICPNGVVVGRDGEGCVFSTCPTIAPQEQTKSAITDLQFEDRGHRFRFTYPSSFTQTVQNQGNVIRLAHVIASGKSGSVLTDGSLLFFEPVNVGTNTLDHVADTLIQELTFAGRARLTQEKHQETIHGYNAISFGIEAQGQSQHLLIQKDTKSLNALHVTSQVVDPKNQNYQQQIDKILSTLELAR